MPVQVEKLTHSYDLIIQKFGWFSFMMEGNNIKYVHKTIPQTLD